jgi:hypothetical protein
MSTHVRGAKLLLMAQLGHEVGTERGPLCPGNSDINLFCDRQGVVDLDLEIADCAFDLCMAKQELNGTQIACPPVDQGRFRAPEGMGSE